MVRSNKEARKRLTESNGTPAMDLGHMNDVFQVVFLCYVSRKHHTLSQERGIRQHEQTGKRTSEDKERADRCGVRASRKDV